MGAPLLAARTDNPRLSAASRTGRGLLDDGRPNLQGGPAERAVTAPVEAWPDEPLQICPHRPDQHSRPLRRLPRRVVGRLWSTP
jgi:hypothetical protein